MNTVDKIKEIPPEFVADRIKRLEARVAELEGERDGYEKRAIRFAKGVRKKEAKIQRLREALGRIAAMDVSGGTQVIMRFPEGDVILGLIQEERYTDIKRVKEALENAT